MLLPRAPFHRYESSRILKTPLINRAGPRGSPRDTSSKRILLEFMSVLAVKSYPREIAACSRPAPFDIHRFLLSFRRNTPILFDNCQFRLSNVFVNVNDGFPSSTLCKRWKKYTLAVSFPFSFCKSYIVFLCTINWEFHLCILTYSGYKIFYKVFVSFLNIYLFHNISYFIQQNQF